jgi:hypothetical protein
MLDAFSFSHVSTMSMLLLWTSSEAVSGVLTRCTRKGRCQRRLPKLRHTHYDLLRHDTTHRRHMHNTSP